MKINEKNILNNENTVNQNIVGAVVLKDKQAVLLGIPHQDNWIREANKTLIPLWGLRSQGLNIDNLPSQIDFHTATGEQVEILAYQPNRLDIAIKPRLPEHWVWVPIEFLPDLVLGIDLEQVDKSLDWLRDKPLLPDGARLFLPENSVELSCSL